MRRAFAFTLVAGACVASLETASAQSIIIRTDPNVELVAIAFRLAGRSEYNLTRVPAWAEAVERHFGPHREHLAVDMARRWGFGFFIPMNLAIHLTPTPELSERSPFVSSGSLHSRWTAFPDSTKAFVERLRGFERDAGFAEFWTAQRALLDTAAARLSHVARGLDRQWIDSFWGRPVSMNYILVPSLTNGAASYGQEYVPATGIAEGYALMGVTRVDKNGLPLFDATDEPTVLHELNHPYVTPLIKEHAAELKPFAEALFGEVANAMRAQSYGSWDAMLNESLVRAAVVHYYMVHGAAAQAERLLAADISAGFLWMRELVALVGEYDRNRRQYPSMAEFMPRIVAFFEQWRPRHYLLCLSVAPLVRSAA